MCVCVLNTMIPKAELTDPQIKDLHHGELVIPPGELAMKQADEYRFRASDS